jgi:hypothetical protein
VARIAFTTGSYATSWDQFRYFGPTASRFDHQVPGADGLPCEQECGILYLGVGNLSIPTCLAEVFQSTRIIDRASRSPVLAGFTLTTDITLLDLTGPYATAIGASMAIHSGPRPRARRWAQQLYLAHSEAQGLLYASSMFGGAPAVALFERARSAIPSRSVFHRHLRDPALENVLTETALTIGYGLV